MNINESEKYQISIDKNLKKYKKKIDKINRQIEYLKLLSMSYDKNQIELPVPLKFNDITLTNIKKEKSKKYTKYLINKLKKRSNKNKENINNNDKIQVKIEVHEEIEIPSLEYA